MVADPRKFHRNNDIMDHSVGSIAMKLTKAVAAAVERYSLPQWEPRGMSTEASRQNHGGSKNPARPTRQPSELQQQVTLCRKS
ncbi:hypothetical protein LSAT2_021943 [Lamellibrachia satsuma]|nr:hypothetical protein LSAT2_021943 [Lamellibrachia satsuma]